MKKTKLKGLFLKSIFFVIILSLLSIQSQAAFTFSNFYVTDSTILTQSTYVFGFTSTITSTNLDVVIIFPIEYSISEFASNAQCYYSQSGIHDQYLLSQTCEIQPSSQANNLYLLGSIVTTIDYISPTLPKYIAVKNIINPNAKVSSFFKVCLRKNGVLLECQKQFGRVTFSSNPIATTSTEDILVNPTVIVGQGSSYIFKGILSSQYSQYTNNQIKIRLIFPQKYGSDDPMCSIVKYFPNGTEGAYQQTLTNILPATPYTLDCSISDLSNYLGPSNELMIKVQNMINPIGAGLYTDFKLKIIYNPLKKALEQMTFTKSVQIQTQTLDVSIKQSNYMRNSTNIYYFFINHETQLGQNSKIQFEFPLTGWQLYSAFPVIGFTSPQTMVFQIDQNIITVYNYGIAASTTQQIIGINLTSYSVSGNYPVQISTVIQEQLIGEWSGYAYLNQTIGSLNLLSISSVQKEVKLPVDSTGPLQMRFFLNYQLPPSQDVQNGTLLLSIYPRIVKPDPDTKGVVKCFWAGYYEGSCTYDDSMSDRTVINITSPPHSAYKYSQIPLIITTEGGTDTDNLGLTISPLVQRYRFEAQFYIYNSSVTPSQVFYTTWIADAIQIDPSDISVFSATHQCDQQTHLQINITMPALTSGLTKQFRFMVQFLNADGSAWAHSLGYQFDKIYQRYPCLVDGLSGDNIFCDLYTYYERITPYSNLHINNDVTGPYFIIYGFDQPMSPGDLVTIQIPKIKIGNSVGVNAQLGFSILEQTPGQKEPYVQLYYIDLTVFTTLAASTLIDQNVPNTVGSIRIQTSNQYDITWNVDSPSSVSYIIYEFTPDQLPSLQNMNGVCTTNQCSGFGLPANHIFQTPVSVAASHTMQTIIDYIVSMDYLSDVQSYFPIKIRTFSNLGTTIGKYEMDIHYIAYPITNSQFTFLDTQIYGGLQQSYSVSFDNTDTLLSEYAFMRFIASDGLSFVDPPQCSSININFYNQSQLICIREDAQTLRVHNFQTLSALGSYAINFKMQTTQTTPFTSSISPKIDIQINHNHSVDSSIVSLKQDLLLNGAPVSPILSPPQKFQIHNPQILNENIKIGYIGPLYIQFQSTTFGLFDVTLTFNNHQYNGGIWTTPTSNDLDPVVCLINQIRYECSPTNGPLTINIIQAQILNGINQLRIDTEYIDPFNGIQYPSEAGMYLIEMSLNDGTLVSDISFYAEIHAPNLLHLEAQTICKDIGTQSVYKFNFSIDATSINDYSDSVMYSRIFVQFPTLIGSQSVFDWNLGGYEGKTHERVGCYFHVGGTYVLPQATKVLQCRLLPSLKIGDPVRVQIINHQGFTSAQILSFYIFKIINPSTAFSSVPIRIKIDHYETGTGRIYPLYDEQYRLFMDPYSQYSTTIIPSQSGSNNILFASSTDVGDDGHVILTAHRITTGGIFTEPFYMITKFPQYFELFDEQLGFTTDTFCPSSGFEECISIPQINYFMVKSYSQPAIFHPRVIYPQSISQQDSLFYSSVIEDGRYTGDIEHTISASNRWQQILGTLTFVECRAAGNQFKAVKGKKKFEMLIEFIITNPIPETGSIQIGLPASLSNIQPHCRSSISTTGATTDLIGKAGTTGQVGCVVQNSTDQNKWVITGFQAIAAGATILVKGVVDLPDITGTIGAGHITTYADNDPLDININGSMIDHLDIPDYQLIVVDTYAMNANQDVFMTQRSVVRAGYIGQFKMIFESDQQIKITDQITFRLGKNDIKNIHGVFNGFTVNPDIDVCQFIKLDSNQQIGCRVDLQTQSIVTGQQAVIYTVRPTQEPLQMNVKYQVRLTTQKYSEPASSEGINYPTIPGTYKIETIITVNSIDTIEHRYIQVYGTQFTALKLTQYNYLPSQYNLIWIQLTPTTNITTDHQIILEFPTQSNDGSTVMFTDDLGLADYQDGERVPVDIFDTVFTDENNFMQCRIYHGDTSRAKPVRLVCGNLAQTLTSADTIRFAFGFWNPPQLFIPGAPQQLAIPIMVYSYDPFYFRKTNFNIVSSAVVVLFTYNIATSLSPNGHFSTTSGQYQYQNDDVLFGDAHTYQLIGLQDSFVIKFNFPLRVNGRYDGYCKTTGGVPIGNAYYHERLRVIVCKLTQNLAADQAPTASKIMVSGFYSPWYRLADSQRQVYGIATYNSTSLSQVIKYNDLFPHQVPRYDFGGIVSTLVVTPVLGHNIVCQNDDYVFQVTLVPGSTVQDLQYCKMISIHFPDNTIADYFTINTDCVQYLNSDLQVIRCDIDFVNRALYVEIIPGIHNNGKTLRVKTKDLAIGNPCSVYTPVDVNNFVVFFYSWENITSADQRLMKYAYMTMDTRNIMPSGLIYTQQEHPAGTFRSHHPFQWIHNPHQRYFEQFPQFTTGQFSPFSFQIMFTGTNPPPTSGILHKLILYYGSEYTTNSFGSEKDLEYNKPICYLHNNRIQRCTIDTTAKTMQMIFDILLPQDTSIHVYFSVHDPRQPNKNGFYYRGTNSDLNRVRLDLQHNDGTVYLFETQPFPGKQTQTGTTLPQRAIQYATIDWGTNQANKLNIVQMTFHVTRTDITGLQFFIPLVDEVNNPIYGANLATAFFGISDGGRYPCGNNDPTDPNTGNPKCYIYNGNNQNMGYPTVITMVDFNYDSTAKVIKARLLLYNPDILTAYFSIRVRAFKGTADTSSTFGHKYVGSWNFFNLFMPVGGIYNTPTVSNDQSLTNQMYPTSSLWRQKTSWIITGNADTIPMGGAALSIGGYIVLQIPIYDANLGFNDPYFCRIDFTPGDSNSDDVLIVDSKQNNYKKAYFIKKWQGTPWNIDYFKCKHYDADFLAYYMVDLLQTQQVTHQIIGNNYYLPIADKIQIDYYDLIGSRAILDLDFSTIMTTINTVPSIYQWSNQQSYQLYLTMTFQNALYSGSPSKCYVTGGFYNSKGGKPICSVVSSTQFLINNFNQMIPHSVNGRYVVKVEFDISPNNVSDTTDIGVQAVLYANYDARLSTRQWIFNTDQLLVYTRSFTFYTPWIHIDGASSCAIPTQYVTTQSSYTSNDMNTQILQFDFNTGLSTLDVKLRITPNGGSLSGLVSYDYSYLRFNFHVQGFDFGCTSIVSSNLNFVQSGTSYPQSTTGATCNTNGFSFIITANMVGNWNALNTFTGDSYLDVDVSAVITPQNSQQPYKRDWIGVRSFLYSNRYNHDPSSCGCSACCGCCFGACSTTVDQYYGYQIGYIDWTTTHTLPLAISMSLNPLTYNSDTPTQFSIQFPQIYKPIGKLTSGKILLIELISSSTNIPFTYINDTATKIEHKIQCQCISSWTPSSAEDANCYFRKADDNFANHALTVDIDVSQGHSLSCFFPGWIHPVGNLYAVAKLINQGSSYPSHINNTNMYGSFLSVTSPTITFSSNMIDTNNILSVAENSAVYSTSVSQYVNTVYGSTYQLILTTSIAVSNPIVYLDFQKSGFIPDQSICNSAAIFTYCRVYNTFRKIIVAQFTTSTASTIFKFVNSSTSLQFPKHKQPQNVINQQYDIIVRMKMPGNTYYSYQDNLDRQQGWLLPSDIDFFVQPEIGVGSFYETYSTNIILSFQLLDHLIYPNHINGAIIVITQNVGVLTGTRGCSVISINNPAVQLDCIITGGRIQITNKEEDYSHTDAGLIQVIFGINNPSTDITWTIQGYQYYVSTTDYGLQFQKTVLYPITSHTGIKQQRNQIRMLPFVTKIYSTAYSPFRIAMKFSNIPPSLPDNLDYPTYSMILTDFDLLDIPDDFTNFQCTFKQYSLEPTSHPQTSFPNSYRNWKQRTQYIPLYAYCSQYNDTALLIEMPRLKPLNIDYYYELVIMPTGITLPKTGFNNLADDQFRLLTIPDSSEYIGTLQQYYGHNFQLKSIYLVTQRPQVDTALQIKFKMLFSSMLVYPQHYLQIHFRDLNMDAIKPSYKFKGGQVPCTLSSQFVTAGRTNDPHCIVNHVHQIHGDIVLRVLQLGNLPLLATDAFYKLSLDDFYLPDMTNLNEATEPFTICIRFISETGAISYYQRCFGQIFIVDGEIDITPMTTQLGTFANPASTYGEAVVGSLTHNYPMTTPSISKTSQKAMVRISGGYTATTPSPLSFSGYSILWYNQDINLYILQQPGGKAITNSQTFTMNGLINPEPYQKQEYELINTIQMTYYDDYHPVQQVDYPQPLYSYFTLVNPPPVLLAASFQTDIRNKVPTDTPSIAVLQINILESVADLTIKLNDKLVIQFDAADVSNIQDCWVDTVTDPISYSKVYRCQVLSSNQIALYDFYNSQVNDNLTLYVELRFINTDVDVTCTLYSDNGQIQYFSSRNFNAIASNINLGDTKVPTLTFTENFYTPYYFQQAIIPLTISTPVQYLYLSMYLPADFVQTTTKLVITLPASIFPNDITQPQQICQWLQVDLYGRKYNTGVYSHCEFLAGILTVQSPFGGLPADDGTNRIPYLLKIRELDIINTAYVMPTTTIPQQIYFQFDNNGNLQKDTLIIYPYEHFSSLKFKPYSLNVDQLNTYHLQFTPTTTITAGTEIILELSIDTRYIDDDLGIQNLFANYGIDEQNQTRLQFSNYNIQHDIISNRWINGDPYSCYTSNKLLASYSAKQTSVHKSSYHSHKIRITHLLQPSFAAGTQFIWKIPLLKNPSALQVPFRMNLTLYNYQSGSQFPQKELFYEIINQYFTVSDNPTSITYNIIADNDIQSTTAQLGIQVSQAPTNTDIVEMKFDNQVAGLINIPDFMGYTQANSLFDFYFFPRINLMIAHKKSTDGNTSVQLGELQVTNNYADYIGYDWIKYHSATTLQTTKQSGSSHKILQHCTITSSVNFAVVEGYSSITGSEYLLQWEFQNTVCMIPKFSTLILDFASSNIYQPLLKSPCYISFRQSSCLPTIRGLQITFYQQILPNSGVIKVQTYIRVTGAPTTSQTFTGFIFSIPGEQFTKVIQFTNIGSLTVTDDNLIDNPQFEHIMVRNLYQNTQMDIRGTIIPRLGFTDMNIKYPFPAATVTNQSMILRQNSTSPYLFDLETQLDWQRKIQTIVSTNQADYTVPPNGLIDYSIQDNNQYTFILQTTYETTGLLNDFTIGPVGSYYQFQYKTFDQIAYEQVYPLPIAQHLIIINPITNIDEQTALGLQFTVTNHDIVPGNRINIQLDSHNLMYDMYKETSNYQIQCVQKIQGILSDDPQLVCEPIQQPTLSSPNQALIITVIPKKTVTAGTQIQIWLSPVINPSQNNMVCGVIVSVDTNCLGQKRCQIYESRGYYRTQSSLATSFGTGTFTPSPTDVLTIGASHTFDLSQSRIYEVFFVKYPENYQDYMPLQCVGGSICVVFPSQRKVLVIFDPVPTTASSQLVLTNMNNGMYLQPQSNDIDLIGITNSELLYFDILHQNLTTRAQIPRISAPTTMTITPTQTPSYFLRNYMNTATIQIYGLYSTTLINCFYINAPVEIVTWDNEYCNASIYTPATDTYPTRLLCSHINDTTLQILIPQGVQQNYIIDVTDQYIITVHTKFFIEDFLPGTGILYVDIPVDSGTFNAYGSYSADNHSYAYYMTEAQTVIQISEHRVPILGDANFNTQSYTQRLANVNQSTNFELLIDPITTDPIHRIQIIVPDQFNYPPTGTHDACQLISTFTEDITNCYQIRKTNKTILSVQIDGTTYDNGPRILKLGSQDQEFWFTAPEDPGSWYNFTVLLYGAAGQLLEAQTTRNSSNIGGLDLSMPDIVVTNGKDSLQNQIVDIQFKTGNLDIRQGYHQGLSTGQKYTQIRIGFENLGAYDQKLGLNIENGQYAGCVFRAIKTREITCTLDIGYDFNDQPYIAITGYQQILPNSVVEISLSNILNLDQNQRSTLYIAVVLKKVGDMRQAFLYNPTKKVLLPTTPLVTTVPTSVSISYTTKTVGLQTVLTFQITPTQEINSYFVLKFPQNGINNQYDLFNPSCLHASIDVYYRSDIVRITPTNSHLANQPFTYIISGFPSTQYSVPLTDWQITVQAYKDLKQVNTMQYILTGFQVSPCSLAFGLLSITSPYIYDTGVQYIFQFQIKDTNLEQNELTLDIQFPSQYGDLRSQNLVCKMDSNATCSITRTNSIQISNIRNTNQLKHIITISNIKNPSTLSNQIIISSYIGSDIDNIICQSQQIITLLQSVPEQCSFSTKSTHHTQYSSSTYSFNIQCQNVFKNQSQLLISLPRQYIYNNNASVECWASQQQNLLDPYCSLEYINGTHYLKASNIFIQKNQIQMQIHANLNNPALTGQYQFKAQLSNNNFVYITTNQHNISIQNGSPSQISSVQLINIPKQSGSQATYFMRVPTSSINQSLEIYFPTQFDLTSSIQVHKFSSNSSTWASQLNYQDIQSLSGLQLQSSITTNYNLKQSLKIEETNTQIQSQGTWTYFMIKSINNPAYQSQQQFTINSYYYINEEQTQSLLTATLTQPLNYSLNPPTQNIHQVDIDVTDDDILQLANYTLTYRLENQLITNSTQFYITPPYKGAIYAMISLNCCLIVNSSFTYCNICTIYEESYQFMIQQDDIIINDEQNFKIELSSIYNPPNETDCTKYQDFKISYFDLKIMKNKEITLFKTSLPTDMDGKPCQIYKLLRGDIIPDFPDILYAGMIHNFTIRLSQPTKLLQVTLSCTDSSVTFQPSKLYFSNYQTMELTGQIVVSSLALDNQKAYINVTHFQGGQFQLFRPNLPYPVKIMSSGYEAYVYIQNTKAQSIGYDIQIPITLSSPASVDMYIQITPEREDSKMIFDDLNIMIPAGQTTSSLTFKYMGSIIPQTLKLKLDLTSPYPLQHSLEQQNIYLYFSESPKYQTLPPVMSIQVMDYYRNNSDQIGRKIYHYANSTYLKYDNLLPNITQHQDIFVGSTSASIQVHTRQECSIAYIILQWGNHETHKPQSPLNLKNSSSSIHLKTFQNQTLIVNPYTHINLTLLEQQTTYYIYMMAYSTMGNSQQITTHVITTGILSPAAKFNLITDQVLTDNVDIVKKLAQILMVDPRRIRVSSSHKNVQQTYKVNSDTNQPYYIQQIIISPSFYQDTVPAIDVINDRLIHSDFGQERLKQLIPSWIGRFDTDKVRQINRYKPKPTSLPQASRISYYNVTLEVKYWQDTEVHAILIATDEETQDSLKYTQQKIIGKKVTPSSSVPNSKQISKGLNQNNDRAQQHYMTIAQSTGEATIFFNKLKPGRKYIIYITGISAQNYEPILYASDSDVMYIQVYTLWNPNLRNQYKLILDQLKEIDPTMYQAITSFYKNQQQKKNNKRNLNKD